MATATSEAVASQQPPPIDAEPDMEWKAKLYRAITDTVTFQFLVGHIAAATEEVPGLTQVEHRYSPDHVRDLIEEEFQAQLNRERQKRMWGVEHFKRAEQAEMTKTGRYITATATTTTHLSAPNSLTSVHRTHASHGRADIPFLIEPDEAWQENVYESIQDTFQALADFVKEDYELCLAAAGDTEENRRLVEEGYSFAMDDLRDLAKMSFQNQVVYEQEERKRYNKEFPEIQHDHSEPSRTWKDDLYKSIEAAWRSTMHDVKRDYEQRLAAADTEQARVLVAEDYHKYMMMDATQSVVKESFATRLRHERGKLESITRDRLANQEEIMRRIGGLSNLALTIATTNTDHPIASNTPASIPVLACEPSSSSSTQNEPSGMPAVSPEADSGRRGGRSPRHQPDPSPSNRQSASTPIEPRIITATPPPETEPHIYTPPSPFHALEAPLQPPDPDPASSISRLREITRDSPLDLDALRDPHSSLGRHGSKIASQARESFPLPLTPPSLTSDIKESHETPPLTTKPGDGLSFPFSDEISRPLDEGINLDELKSREGRETPLRVENSSSEREVPAIGERSHKGAAARRNREEFQDEQLKSQEQKKEAKHMEQELWKREQALKKREEESEQRELDLIRKQEAIRKKEEEIRQREEEIRKREEELSQKARRIEESREETRKKEEELCEQARQLERERTGVRRREEQLQHKEEELQRRGTEINTQYDQKLADIRQREERIRCQDVVGKQEEARKESERLHHKQKKRNRHVSTEDEGQSKESGTKKIEGRRADEIWGQKQTERAKRKQEEEYQRTRQATEDCNRRPSNAQKSTKCPSSSSSSYSGHPPISSSASCDWTSAQTHVWGSSQSPFSIRTSVASFSPMSRYEQQDDSITNWERRQEELYQKQQEQFRKEQEQLESKATSRNRKGTD